MDHAIWKEEFIFAPGLIQQTGLLYNIKEQPYKLIQHKPGKKVNKWFSKNGRIYTQMAEPIQKVCSYNQPRISNFFYKKKRLIEP